MAQPTQEMDVATDWTRPIDWDSVPRRVPEKPPAEDLGRKTEEMEIPEEWTRPLERKCVTDRGPDKSASSVVTVNRRRPGIQKAGKRASSGSPSPPRHEPSPETTEMAVPEPDSSEPLEALASALGHEIFNPLTSCACYLHQLDKEAKAGSEAGAAAVDGLRRNLDRIHNIVGELQLIASAPNRGPEPVDLAKVVRRVHDQLSGLVKHEPQLDLEPAWLHADRARLEQLVCLVLTTHRLCAPPESLCRIEVARHRQTVHFEIVCDKKLSGPLRVDLLGIVRQQELPSNEPMSLAAQVVRAMGGDFHQAERDGKHRIRATLPAPRIVTRRPSAVRGG